MKQAIFLILSCLLCLATPLKAEQALLQWLLDRYDEDTLPMEELEEWLSHETDSFNINTANREQLELLPFLNPIQIEQLLEYRFDYGPLVSMYELYYLSDWDEESAGLLSEIAFAGEIEDPEMNWKTANFNAGKHTIKMRAGGCLQSKAGYENGLYGGIPVNGWLKYGYRHPLLQANLTLEQDEGEPLDFKHGPGVDFYSGNITFNRLSFINQLIIGDYKANYGQGLVIRENSFFSSTPIVIFTENTCKPYTSTTEYGYLRGMAFELDCKKFELHAFGSYLPYDNTYGLHRTEKEIAQKSNHTKALAGLHANCQIQRFRLGITGLYHFSKKVSDPVWNQSFNISTDYRYTGKRWLITGELAMNQSAHIATVNRFWTNLSSYIQLELAARYYDRYYTAAEAHSYTKSKRCDEYGILSQLGIQFSRNLKADIQLDTYALGPMVKKANYTLFNHESDIQMTYSTQLAHKLFVAYKHKKQSTKSGDNQLHRIKFYWQYGNRTESLQFLKHEYHLKTGLAHVWLHQNAWQKGTMVYLDFSYQYNFNKRNHVQIAWNAAVFDTQNYSTQLYLTVHEVGSSVTGVGLYGLGGYQSILLNCKLSLWKIGVRLSDIRYLDRNTISSDNEQISGNHKTTWRIYVSKEF
ncbi:MAG: helix-hairpin-helix domain-containing protein [Paludibacteraceae bacterium]|nr:helix-hairpin-helix domain-containing protein [Paludibacteraceae bacterium]